MDGFVRICDKGNYDVAYEDYKSFELGFNDEEIAKNIVDKETFIRELQLGYGKSEITQIARLKETEDGIWYDNEYC